MEEAIATPSRSSLSVRKTAVRFFCAQIETEPVHARVMCGRAHVRARARAALEQSERPLGSSAALEPGVLQRRRARHARLLAGEEASDEA